MRQDFYSQDSLRNGQPASPAEQRNLPMRAVLLDANGTMHDLWLPAVKEGKFAFAGAEGLVSIIAEADRWVAVCGGNGYFETMDGRHPNRVALQDRTLVKAAIGARIFSIYTETDYGTGNLFLPYYVERYTDIIIGRSPSCDLYCANPYVSRPHASLRWSGNSWTVTDLRSTNGVYVNGKAVASANLALGDVIYIMGVFIVIGSSYIAINNADDRVVLTTPRVRPIQRQSDMLYAKAEGPTPQSFFDRKPRKKYQLSVEPIEIDMPPAPMSANKIPLALRLGSSAVMGGRSIVTGNYVSALTSLVFPALTQGITEKDRKDYEEKRTLRYREYLQAKEEEISQEISYEQRFLNEITPNLNQMLRFSEDQDRLWERRKIDEDFLTVRLGRGDRPMVAEKQYPPKRFEMEPDFLLEEMYQLAEKPAILKNVPVSLSLREDWTVGIVGDHRKALYLVRNMIMALAVTHAYDDLKLALFVDREDAELFSFAKYLRHFWDNERNIRFFAASRADTQTVAKYLGDHWHTMMDEIGSKDIKAELKKQPSYIVFFLSKDLYDQAEFFKELLAQEAYSGISLVAAFDNAPKECSKLIDLRSGSTLVDLVHPEVEDQPFEMDQASQQTMDISMRQLTRANLRMDSQSFALPSMITFLEMYGAGRVEHLNPMARWVENNPVSSLAVPIGVGTDGKLFTLDLHEKRQGPHGLVAGMTGSGKSEFIITYILSMAVNFSPDEVAFILIDYKGGGLADAFVDPKRGIHLPHVVATITNLDGAAIQRSLVSIHSELKRRQAVFKQAKSETNEGTMDIYDYQKLYRNKRVKEPMPHLFIISDEFAELKKQQPEFMDELISTARIGRSLGVHLILATQKPGGVVNDQIWSNTKFRACLRVQDKGDSMEMLKRPEAAELKNTGRFYLQVGYNELFALGQSAWCGAGYYPQEEVISEKDESVRFLDDAGQTILQAKPRKKVQKKAESKQIVAIVQYLSDLAKREGIVPRSLWKEPLPKQLEYDSLEQQVDLATLSPLEAVVGLVDNVEHQEQFPLTVDFLASRHFWICGTSGSGKSHLIRTMLYSLMKRCTPSQFSYYIMDFSGGALKPAADTPWCGAYLTEENGPDFDRLLKMVQETVAKRKKIFAEADVTNFNSYLEVGTMPLMLVIIDNYTAIQGLKRGIDLYSSFGNYLKDAAGTGVCFLLSSNFINEIHSRTRQEIDYRIALQCKDKYEYTDVLGIRCNLNGTTTPGRGVCVVGGECMEYHAAMTDCTLNDNERAQAYRARLAELAARLPDGEQALRLPMASSDQSYEDFCLGFEPGRIPLGYLTADMKPVAIPLKQCYCMPVFLGNPNGVAPVWNNLIHAAAREQMELVIVRGAASSIFEKPELVPALRGYPKPVTMLDSSEEGMIQLSDILQRQTVARNVPRDEYCQQNGIPASAKNRALRAEKYIRARCGNLLVLFERFGDVAGLPQTETWSAIEKNLLTPMLERARGYCIYFFAGFYPEDEELRSPLIKSLNQSKLALLFGGQYSRQCLFNTFPMDLRRQEKVNPNYDRFSMFYRNDYYDMRMPCGPLVTRQEDPDDEAIVG